MKTRLQSLKSLFVVTLALFPVICGYSGDVLSVEAGKPPDEPILRIEAGMHTARIWRIGIDRAERYLVTSSDDKTARIWDLGSGKLLGVLRAPIGLGSEGRLYCVAISPDGKTVATGGWTKGGKNFHNIYLFDRTSGRMKKRVSGLPAAIFHLAYSPDNRFLVAVLSEKGIRVYGTRDYDEIYRDTEYSDRCNWADFNWQGDLVTSCYDGYLRLYDPSFRLIAKKKVPGGEKPYSVSFSPDGSRIAVGFQDSTSVNVLSGKDLSFLYAPDTNKVDNGSLFKVAWSRDGQILYAGGTYSDETNTCLIMRWTEAGRVPYTVFSASTSTIMSIRPLADGRVVFGTGEPSIGILDASGGRDWTLRAPILDLRMITSNFLISPDGSVVQFGYLFQRPGEMWNRRRARFDINKGRLSLDPTDEGHEKLALGANELSPPRTEAPGIEITGWENAYKPRLNGKEIELNQYEMSRSLAIAPDKKHFLLGTGWNLRFFDAEGKQLWYADAPGSAWAVNIASNGKIAAAAFSDGTIRWYRLSDGQEQLAFFPAWDGNRWVLWTPEGFFNAASGGENLIGYHLNQGSDKAGEFVGVDQLYDLFYRPDLVVGRLEGGYENKIKTELRRIGDIKQVLASGLPPVVELLTPQEVYSDRRNFILKLKVTDKGGGIGKVVYRIDGVTFEKPVDARPVPDLPDGQRSGIVSRTLTASNGDHDVTVTFYDCNNKIASRPVKLKVHVDDPNYQQPSLYVLAVGISSYRDYHLKLRYAAGDAKAIAEELESRGRALFRTIEVKRLLDREATTEGIERAFEDLADRVKENDVFVLYLAGHGTVLDEGRYYFVPWEVRYVNQEALRRESISQGKLTTLLGSINAMKSLVMLDTCNSGNFDFAARGLTVKTAIDLLMRATGRNFLAASSELAMEGYGGHGVFTYALLQGLRGQADQQGNKDGTVSIYELVEFVSNEVPRITMREWNYEQIPMNKLEGIPFPIGRTR